MATGRQVDAFRFVSLGIALLFTSVVLLVPVSRLVTSSLPLRRVVRLTGPASQGSASSYEGLYVIGVSPTDFVLSDRPGNKSATIRLIKRDQATELQFVSDT